MASIFSPKLWFLAARPKTLWAGICPVMIGTALAISDGAFHLGAVLAALGGALFIQIGTIFSNDYFDFKKGADTVERLGPQRMTQSGVVKPETMKWAFIIAFGLAVLCGVYLVLRGGVPVIVIGVLSLLSGFLYTAGPKPLAYVGLGDVFAFVFFGPVAVAGTYYVQALTIEPLAILAGVAPGLFSVALLTVNNLRDIDSDRKASKKTLAVRFGKIVAKVEYISALSVACLIPFVLILITGWYAWCILAMGTFLVAIPTIRTVLTKQGAPLNAALEQTGKLLLIYTVLFCIGWIWG